MLYLVNSALQALASIAAFTSFFLDCGGHIEATRDTSLSRVIAATLRAMWSSEGGSIVPRWRMLVQYVRREARAFEGYGQQVPVMILSRYASCDSVGGHHRRHQ